MRQINVTGKDNTVTNNWLHTIDWDLGCEVVVGGCEGGNNG